MHTLMELKDSFKKAISPDDDQNTVYQAFFEVIDPMCSEKSGPSDNTLGLAKLITHLACSYSTTDVVATLMKCIGMELILNLKKDAPRERIINDMGDMLKDVLQQSFTFSDKVASERETQGLRDAA